MMFGTDSIAIDRLLLDLVEEKRAAEGAPSLWDRSKDKIDPKAHLDYHKSTFIHPRTRAHCVRRKQVWTRRVR
jgi:hypothetical protein